ncbi:Re/Si-specific NAD(P)(+) transhydrogenase subunit alpha [Gemmatimonas phototrophica]|uniref:proton-translocating NAD(P)(+) transhydrogenase n=1 Tax=Gemmatimonas phototrophica TaxID=1379270 RepID=A0A143BFR0_9BACT|nr:Re/Si-specific NAD(P)(+) transhydrogenase subunit alpha [Gemmatimonas phototrophica]AMW03839.1 NAD(P) transhydrogenase subunit alpha [Gemmatimonas phototrophica]
MKICVVAETAPNESRVALIPDSVSKLVKAGHEVVVQAGAGARAHFDDASYLAAGASIAPTALAAHAGAEIVVRVQRPDDAEVTLISEGAVLVSLMAPASALDTVVALSARRVTALALELVPRITRAQSMDVLSSQATVAGYKAVLIGASLLPRFLPMLTTAAGSITPAKAFVLGAGVAGLQALATARRLGAVTSGFDVRPAAAEQVKSLGATFVQSDVVSAASEDKGGYAKAQSDDEAARTLATIAKHIASQDLVVTTAQIPGRAAPRLITADMVRSMKPGSVIVDLAADTGGNCELTVPGETIEVNGVQVVGATNLPATMPTHASQMFSRNVLTLLQHIVSNEGTLTIDLADEITGAMALTHAGTPKSDTPKSATPTRS